MALKFRTIFDAIGKNQGTEFDTHKIYHIKAGKKINNYDFIQENNVDTEIYPTLEKYGTLKPMEINHAAIAQELEEMDLMTISNQRIAADNMWLNLPLEVRQKFDNDKLKFLENGKKWLEEEITKANQAQQPVQQQEPQPQPEGDKK